MFETYLIPYGALMGGWEESRIKLISAESEAEALLGKNQSF